MDAKNFKPGQVWKTRDDSLVGITRIDTNGGNFPVYACILTGKNTGDALNFTLEGQRSTAQSQTNPLDLMELRADAPADTERTEFQSVEIGSDELPDELKAILGGLISKIASSKRERDGKPCQSCSRDFADVLTLTAIEKGYLSEPANTGTGLMKEIQDIMAARKSLDV